MELVRSSSDTGMLRFTYYVKPEFEARKIKESMINTLLCVNNLKIKFFT